MSAFNMSSFETDILMQLIGEKHEYLVQLRDAGRMQAQLIDAGDMTQLLKLLSSKQRILGVLQNVERKLDPFRAQNTDSRTWRSPADRQRGSQLSLQCDRLLAEVVEGERQGEAQLTAHRDRTANQLEIVQHAALARAAYTQVAPTGGFNRLDLSSGCD